MMRGSTVMRMGLIGAVFVLAAQSALAVDIVNLGTLPVVTWDRQADPTTMSTPITLSVYNATPGGPTETNFFGYSLAVKVEPVAANGGTITLTGYANPSNPVFTTFAGNPVASNAGGGFTGITNQNSDTSNVMVPAAPGKGLVSFTLTTANNALGTYQLVADRSLSTFSDFEGNEFFFGNPGTGNIVLGTIVVAVPEPSSIIAMALGGCALLGMVRYRRRKKTQ